MWPFKTAEVKLLLATMQTLAPAFERNLAFDEVRKRAEKLIRENPDAARRALVEQNRTSKEICLTTVVNIVQEDLRSGEQRHIGGMPTLIGTQWMGMYTTALRQLVEIGFLSEDDRRVNETEFRREMSERFS
jgi:hypothetical protein